ncbi:MAG: hypothetical protein U0270_09165 [Labilithrix sp.]
MGRHDDIQPGGRVTVQWSDGRRYSATVQAVNCGWYGVRFDGQANVEWLPPHALTSAGPPFEGMAAAAAHGVPVYEDGSTVLALRNGVSWEKCMLLEYEPDRRAYGCTWEQNHSGPSWIDPWAIDPRSHFGLDGRAGNEERNNPTVPVGSHVLARSRNGRTGGGTIILNDGERLVIRWDGVRAREYIVKEQIVQMGGVAPMPPPRPGELGLFGSNPELPPHEDRKDWYPDGDPVWARYQDDRWWYEAVVVNREWITPAGQRGYSMYTIDWTDGFGRTRISDVHLRVRRPGLF